jgi:hypothetical protein
MKIPSLSVTTSWTRREYDLTSNPFYIEFWSKEYRITQVLAPRMEIVYKPGKFHDNADGLSRLAVTNSTNTTMAMPLVATIK